MTYPRFRQIAAESPGLIFELATQLATRLDRTNQKLGDLAFVDVTGRVAHAIMDLCGEPDAMTHPEGMQIKVSRQELSRLVGCSREMAGRVLKVLEEQGLLQRHRQDHRGVQRTSQDEDAPGRRAGQGQRESRPRRASRTTRTRTTTRTAPLAEDRRPDRGARRLRARANAGGGRDRCAHRRIVAA